MGTFFNRSTAGSIGNSSLNRSVINDPIHQFIFGRQPKVLPTAGPYAGATPTLAAAARGYATGPQGQAAPLTGQSAQLQGLGNQLAPASAPTMTVRPVMGGQPRAMGAGGIYGY